MTSILQHCNVQLCSLRETQGKIFLDFQIEIEMLEFVKGVKYYFIIQDSSVHLNSMRYTCKASNM